MLIHCSLNVVEGKAKLEILKALEDDDPDLSRHTLVSEVHVAMLGGDPEKVFSSVNTGI